MAQNKTASRADLMIESGGTIYHMGLGEDYRIAIDGKPVCTLFLGIYRNKNGHRLPDVWSIGIRTDFPKGWGLEDIHTRFQEPVRGTRESCLEQAVAHIAKQLPGHNIGNPVRIMKPSSSDYDD